MRLLPLLLALATLACGQNYPRHSFTVGAGAGLPVFARSRSIWEDSALVGAGYGYRFARHWQADAGYQRVFGPGDRFFGPLGVGGSRELGGGSLDSYYFGGRLVFPLGARVLMSGGVGAAHERLRSPRLDSGADLDEAGWGAYILGSVSWALDGAGRFRIAVTPRLEMVQARQAWLHRNRWLMLPLEFGFSF